MNDNEDKGTGQSGQTERQKPVKKAPDREYRKVPLKEDVKPIKKSHVPPSQQGRKEKPPKKEDT